VDCPAEILKPLVNQLCSVAVIDALRWACSQGTFGNLQLVDGQRTPSACCSFVISKALAHQLPGTADDLR